MIYSLELKEEASREFADSFVWYEKQQVGLGIAFRSAVEHKLDLIRNNPYHYRSTYKKYHEALTSTFPFLIVYTIKEKGKACYSFCDISYKPRS